MTTPNDLRITKVNYYEAPNYSRKLIAQSRGIIEIETNQGITGLGEGGSKDLVEDLACFLIGEDPMRTEHLWQQMFRGNFYPLGRESTHALGGIDIALWDIKGKVLNTPVYQLLGGRCRDKIECYATGFDMDDKDIGRAAGRCIDAGFLAFRTGGFGSDMSLSSLNTHGLAGEIHAHCKEVAKGVGEDGRWAIDFHTRLDPPQAIRLAHLIEDLDPLFCEDLVRSENAAYYETIRPKVSVPLAAGEQYATRWDCLELWEKNLIDFARQTLPNTGGITEMRKIMSYLEAHYIGLIPHFTGPISLAAMVHCSMTFTGVVVQEMAMGGGAQHEIAYLNDDYIDFRDGKLYANDRPGIGVELRRDKVEKVLEVSERSSGGVPLLKRPDGSYTNW